LILSSKPTGAWLSATETAQMPLGQALLSTTALDDAAGRATLSAVFTGSRKSRKILELASIPLAFSFALRCYSLRSKIKEKRLLTGEQTRGFIMI
jgi:hypothetical protein